MLSAIGIILMIAVLAIALIGAAVIASRVNEPEPWPPAEPVEPPPVLNGHEKPTADAPDLFEYRRKPRRYDQVERDRKRRRKGAK